VEDHPWLEDHLAQIEAECLSSAEKQDALLAKKKCGVSAVVQLGNTGGRGNRTRQPIMTNINKDGRSKRESMLSEMLMLDKQIGTKCFQRGASLEYQLMFGAIGSNHNRLCIGRVLWARTLGGVEYYECPWEPIFHRLCGEAAFSWAQVLSLTTCVSTHL